MACHWQKTPALSESRDGTGEFLPDGCLKAGDVRFAGSQVPAEIELVGTDGRSDPITVGGDETGALLADSVMLCWRV